MVFKNDNAAPSLRERLRMSDAGTLPQFNPQRRMLVLDAMDRLGRADGSRDRHAAVRLGIHRHAGVQLVQHVHGVLPDGRAAQKRAVPEEGEGSFLEFSAADCVQCNLCARTRA